MEDKINKALKRCEGAELKVCVRGGRIVKIPAQTVHYPPEDGVEKVLEVRADVTDEE